MKSPGSRKTLFWSIEITAWSLIGTILSTLLLNACSTTTISRVSSKGYLESNLISSHPFQVVYSESTFRASRGSVIQKFEFLSINDTLVQPSNGRLLLAHYSGQFLEFRGENLIVLGSLSNEINDQLNLNPDSALYRVDIGFLESREPVQFVIRGAVTRYSPPHISILSPAQVSNEISKRDQKVCIIFEHYDDSTSSSFSVELLNLFAETLWKFESSQQVVEVDLDSIEDDGPMYILRVTNSKGESSGDSVIRLGSEYFFVPSYCEPRSAIEALAMAVYFEKNEAYPLAKSYFSIASQTSNLTYYDTLYRNYIHRVSELPEWVRE